MILRKWEELPDELRTEEIRPYYDILQKKKASLFFKRLLDIVVGMLLLVTLSPIFIILATAIKLDSKGSVFFRQERVTQYGKRFRIHKFRSMVQGSEKGSQITIGNDMRITRIGKVIRKCRLDEIAQVIDLITGNCSLVGTRPEVPRYVERYTPEMMATLLLPAGITCLASIQYKDEARLLENADDVDEVYVNEILPKKMKYNLAAIEHFSFFGEIKIMFMTLVAVFKKEEAERILEEKSSNDELTKV